MHFDILSLPEETLGGPWELIRLILEFLGCILGDFGYPTGTQSAPGWRLADIVKTCENLHVFEDLRGWRRLEELDIELDIMLDEILGTGQVGGKLSVPGPYSTILQTA